MSEAEPSKASERLADLRISYQRESLDIADTRENPFEQFRFWFDEAAEARIEEPNAMIVATVGKDGVPSARTLLLKGVDDDGFRFFTNYGSRKGQEMAENPDVSAVFLWKPLQRQVIVCGRVEKTTREESEAYFHSRPYAHQIGAWASDQSKVIPDRAWMEKREAEFKARFPEGEVPLPDYWGGYVIRPETVEFWQGRPSRLHDRIQYRRSSDGWERVRLSP